MRLENSLSSIMKLGFMPVGPQGRPPEYWRHPEQGVCVALEPTGSYRAYKAEHPDRNFLVTGPKGHPIVFQSALGAAQHLLNI